MAHEPDFQDARDAATVLPVAVAILLVPPVVLIFAKPVTLAGIPLIAIYIFGVWGAAIAAALLLARYLRRGVASSAHRPSGQSDAAR